MDASKEGIKSRLLEIVRETGATRMAMAEVAGCTPQAVQSWLKTGTIRKDKMELLAAHYGYSMLWVLTGVGPKHLGSTTTPQQGLSADEQALLDKYRGLTSEGKKSVSVVATALSSERSKKNHNE